MSGSEQVSLYYSDGRSDKVYQAHLEQVPVGAGWLVNFEYGRRGKPLRSGTKTPQPVPYDVAKAAYDKLVRLKQSKGYLAGVNGVVQVMAPRSGQDTVFRPQLLNQVDQAEVERLFELTPGKLALQTKHDGERRGILVNDEKVTPANRKGSITSLHEFIDGSVRRFSRYLPNTYEGIWDCEDMGDHLVIFDLLVHNGKDLMCEPFHVRARRLVTLQTLLCQVGLHETLVVDTPTWPQSLTELRNFIHIARGVDEEGIVIRHGDALYVPGRPNSGGGALKLKFIESATVRVASIHPTKRSVGIQVWDLQKTLKATNAIDVGNVTIPPNYDIPTVGDLVEVQYLYAYRGGSLFQPVYKGTRNDLLPAAASTNQLKYKR